MKVLSFNLFSINLTIFLKLPPFTELELSFVFPLLISYIIYSASFYIFIIFYLCIGIINVSNFPFYSFVPLIPHFLKKVYFTWRKGLCSVCVCVYERECVCEISVSSTYDCHALMGLSHNRVLLYEEMNWMKHELNGLCSLTYYMKPS